MAKSKEVLGRGLNSLIPQNVNKKNDQFINVDVDKIIRNTKQPRVIFNTDSDFIDLVESIKQKGIIQPLILKETEKGQYKIIAGERRYRAAVQAGLTKVPAVIKSQVETDRELLELALIENINRKDLNPIEMAESFHILITEYGGQEKLSKAIGVSRVKIANTVRLRKLPKLIKDYIIKDQLTEGHGRALLSLEDEKLIIETANKIIQNNLSVRETEKLVKKIKEGTNKKKERKQTDSNLLSLTDSLSQSLNTKVEIKGNSHKGKIVIHYKDSKTLDEIAKILKSNEDLEV